MPCPPYRLASSLQINIAFFFSTCPSPTLCSNQRGLPPQLPLTSTLLLSSSLSSGQIVLGFILPRLWPSSPSRVLPLASPNSTTVGGPQPSWRHPGVDLINFPPDENPSRNASQNSTPWTPSRGTRLWCPSPWQRTRSSPPWWARCVACFMIRGFFLNHLPSTFVPTWWERIWRIQPKQMRFGQSASNQSVNVVSPASPPGQVPDEAALNILHQHPPPRPAPCAAQCTTCPPAPFSSRNSNQWWYHCNHGDQAQRCRPPCSWVPGNYLTGRKFMPSLPVNIT